MFGLNRAPRGSDGDAVSPRRDKLVVAGLTLALGVALVVSTFRQSRDNGTRIRALQTRVAQLNAKQAAARKRVDEATARYPGDEKLFEISKQAGWLTPEEWGEWQRLQVEIEDLGGTATWDDGTSTATRMHAPPQTSPSLLPDPTHTPPRVQTTASMSDTRG